MYDVTNAPFVTFHPEMPDLNQHRGVDPERR
jgi:hypothetical protein